MDLKDIFPVQYSYLIPLAPLVGAAIAGFGCTGARKKYAHWPIWIGVGFAALLAFCLLAQMLQHLHHAGEGAVEFPVKSYFTWIQAGSFRALWGYFFDPLTAVMLCVVCGIGFLITVFSAGYMKGEEGYFRFFAYLGLFIFMMTNLVMGENLVMLYLGWEGVGLCSYLLIGYDYEKPSAREAAKKAFLVNRVGDFGFALGIMLCYYAFGTISYFDNGKGLLELAANPNHSGHWALQYIPFLLMLGAFGKSAQFPLYVWLPDAMEGPTPVSALIHAATMVTAGVYMIVRCGTLFVGNQAAMITVAFVGAFTALFAATIALRQFDLKKVFAYSTVSQLGFMFVGAGVLAPVAGVFHLVTHAFFKALLFLGSGVVMHAMKGELDMRKMSGLKTVLPKTRWVMAIGCCALAGLPPFSGFFSKDEIVAYATGHSLLLGLVLMFTAFLTSYYTFRLYFRVFEGPTVVPPPPSGAHAHGHGAQDAHDDAHEHHDHEPAVMIWPLIVLAIGAIVVGIYPGGERLGAFLGKSPSFVMSYQVAQDAYGKEHVDPVSLGIESRPEVAPTHEHGSHYWVMLVSAAIALAGLGLAYQLHLRDRAAAERLVQKAPGLVNALDHKYWVDELYQAAIVEPLRVLGRVLFWIDSVLVDNVFNVIGYAWQVPGFILKITTQRGYLQGYAAAMLLGIVAILLFLFL
ncbi:MAG TPA: NADH-quinone oxidoreductase subunit L [Tepidisphaeraceae bacterium]